MDRMRGQAEFREAYQGQPPWDIGRAQGALVDLAARVEGTILDVGCGTGDNAIFFAQRGHTVYGVDFVDEAIQRARAKAEKLQLDICFLAMDALQLGRIPMLFDNLIDCGLFHVFDDQTRPRYVESLAGAVRADGHLYLMCFSDREPPGLGPRRVTREELEQAFRIGWHIESIESVRFETSPQVPDRTFSEGGPHAHLATMRRTR